VLRWLHGTSTFVFGLGQRAGVITVQKHRDPGEEVDVSAVGEYPPEKKLSEPLGNIYTIMLTSALWDLRQILSTYLGLALFMYY
jgi:hypothetical protein